MRIILHSEDLGGHRWLHLLQIADWFQSLGAHSVVALGAIRSGHFSAYRNDFRKEVDKRDHLTLSNSTFSLGDKRFEDLISRLASDHEATAIFFADGERATPFLRSTTSFRLKEKWHVGAYFFDFSSIRANHGITRGSSDSVLRGFSDGSFTRSLDWALVTEPDEGLNFSGELVRTFEIPPPELRAVNRKRSARFDGLETFLQENSELLPLWSLGEMEYRKGLHHLVRYAHSSWNARIIALGRRKRTFHFEREDARRFAELRKRGRVFLREGLVDYSAIKSMVEKAPFICLPYESFFRSSGLALSSLSWGVPVIVPKNSQVGSWVLQLGVGLVLENNSPDDVRGVIEKALNSELELRAGVMAQRDTLLDNPLTKLRSAPWS